MGIFDKIALDFVLDNGSQAMSSFLSNRFNKSMMDYEYELNEKAAENAYARQLDFWEKQNSYDDPSSQVRRLQRAGLNPGVLNGNVSNVSNNLSSVSSGGASTPGPRPGKDIDVLSMLVADEQLKNLKANTNLTNEKAEAERLTNMKLAVEANDWDTYWSITLSNAKLQGKQTESSIKKLEAEARKAFEDARQFEEFGADGGNTYEDAHRAAEDAHALASLEVSIKTIAKDVEEATKEFQIETRKSQAELIKEDLAVLKATRLDRISLAKANAALATNQSNIAANEVDYRNYISNFIDLLGFDPRTLPPALQAHILYNYTVLADQTEEHGGISKSQYKEFIDDVHNLLSDYIYKEGHVPQSESDSFSINVLGTGATSSNSSSW